MHLYCTNMFLEEKICCFQFRDEISNIKKNKKKSALNWTKRNKRNSNTYVDIQTFTKLRKREKWKKNDVKQHDIYQYTSLCPLRKKSEKEWNNWIKLCFHTVFTPFFNIYVQLHCICILFVVSPNRNWIWCDCFKSCSSEWKHGRCICDAQSFFWFFSLPCTNQLSSIHFTSA